jgi:hypothetical protein
MSTRSAIIIKRRDDYGPDNPNTGYHSEAYSKHHDGYLMGVGLELVMNLVNYIKNDGTIVTSFTAASNLFKDFLNQNYHRCDNVDNIPGDIEYLYVVNFNDGITVKAFCRPRLRYYPDFPRDPYLWPSLEILNVRLHPWRNDVVYVVNAITLTRDTDALPVVWPDEAVSA